MCAICVSDPAIFNDVLPLFVMCFRIDYNFTPSVYQRQSAHLYFAYTQSENMLHAMVYKANTLSECFPQLSIEFMLTQKQNHPMRQHNFYTEAG